ncbi:hypothetical protein DFJ69_6208 [Thermomonospora umbrina]|uniref:Uncharacterized protein n=2 Tax=Thermomonospora umbrina TaxID=111806 RepID=A0A3D9TA53_9ACTN|nr:hypothetical protein DFJ69_6208 [Thermomonospora umbrina]
MDSSIIGAIVAIHEHAGFSVRPHRSPFWRRMLSEWVTPDREAVRQAVIQSIAADTEQLDRLVIHLIQDIATFADTASPTPQQKEPRSLLARAVALDACLAARGHRRPSEHYRMGALQFIAVANSPDLGGQWRDDAVIQWMYQATPDTLRGFIDACAGAAATWEDTSGLGRPNPFGRLLQAGAQIARGSPTEIDAAAIVSELTPPLRPFGALSRDASADRAAFTGPINDAVCVGDTIAVTRTGTSERQTLTGLVTSVLEGNRPLLAIWHPTRQQAVDIGDTLPRPAMSFPTITLPLGRVGNPVEAFRRLVELTATREIIGPRGDTGIQAGPGDDQAILVSSLSGWCGLPGEKLLEELQPTVKAVRAWVETALDTAPYLGELHRRYPDSGAVAPSSRDRGVDFPGPVGDAVRTRPASANPQRDVSPASPPDSRRHRPGPGRT